MNPSPHREFGDEDIAALRKEDRCFGGDHLDFWIGLHDFLDACERELVEFIIVGIGLEVGDYLLPVGCENVFVGSVKTLVDLFAGQPYNL